MNTRRLLAHFVDGTLNPETFGHREHLQVAYALLSSVESKPVDARFGQSTGNEFLRIASVYLEGIETLASQVGAPEKVNATLTVAWLSLVAERVAMTRECGSNHTFDDFIESNSDLLSSALLSRYYSAERLASPLARTQFVLPDRITQ